MSRYAVLQGNGSLLRVDTGNDDPEAWRKWPHLVAQHPSGHLAILPAFSGFGSASKGGHNNGDGHKYHAYQMMMCHQPFAWVNNKLVHHWRHALDEGDSFLGFAWHPYEQSFVFRNPDGTNFDTNSSFDFHVIFDGFHTQDFYSTGLDSKGGFCALRTPDSAYYCCQITGPSYIYGNSKLDEPFLVDVSPDLYFPSLGNFGNPGDSEDRGHFVFPADNSFNAFQGLISYVPADTSDPDTKTQSPCDMIEHEGSYYFCSQTKVWCTRIGMKGSFIYSDFFDVQQDQLGNATFGLANLSVALGTEAKFNGPQARVFAKHRGALYMLQADGKLLLVQPGGLILRKDFKTGSPEMKSPWASGIAGGANQITPVPAVGKSPTPAVARPFLVSFNDQLHAFLNYEVTSSVLEQQTGSPVAKGAEGTSNARGLLWLTSHDGFNWADRTSMLAPLSSGIITPSGNNELLASWESTIAPYRYSAFQNVSYPSGYGGRLSIPGERNHVGEFAPIERGDDSISIRKPSGYRQATGDIIEASRFSDKSDRLPIWHSGLMVDVPGTPVESLKIRFGQGVISGFMYPTLVDYPSGFAYLVPGQLDGISKPTNLLPEASGGEWGPFGQGARGWDYTGVGWRHTAGHIDEDDEQSNNHRLRLCFSDNPFDSTTNVTKQTASHFWELDKASGWHQRNYVHWGGAFIGYKPVELYDPEVTIPSGSFDDPNPFIDFGKKHVRVNFNVIDFGFWDQVSMKLEYTTDEGQNWHACSVSGSLGPLSTGTKQTDPSGIGADSASQHTVFWRWQDDLGPTTFYPLTRLRMRPEVK